MLRFLRFWGSGVLGFWGSGCWGSEYWLGCGCMGYCDVGVVGFRGSGGLSVWVFVWCRQSVMH